MRDKIKTPKFFSLFFFVLFILSLIVYYFRRNPYVRPNFYFYFLALMTGVIFYQIVVITDNNNLKKALVFVEIILVSLLFTSTQQALYKTVLSRDPWDHGAVISQILITHHIPTYESIGSPYVRMPNFHLLISSSILISNITYKWASYISIGVLVLMLVALITYKVGKYVFGSTKMALTSVLLLTISDNVLDKTGKTIFPNSIGVSIAFLVFYLILRGKINTKLKALLALIILSLSITHTISYLFLIIQTIFILFIFIIYPDNTQRVKIIGYMLIIMWVAAILVWGFVSGHYMRTFIGMAMKLITGLNVERYKSSLTIPFKFVLLARLGMIVYFGLAGVGILHYLYTKMRKKALNTVQLALLSNSAFFVGFGSLTFLIWPGIAHRFWYYGEILGSFFVAYFLLLCFYDSKKHKQIKKVLTGGGILILSWLMFMAPISNDDNPLVPQYSTRTGWHDSEIQAGMFVLHNSGNTPISSDWDYIGGLNDLKWMFTDTPPSNLSEYTGIGWSINVKFPKSFTEIIHNSGYLFIFRKNLIKDRSFELGSRWEKIKYMPLTNNVSEILKEGVLKKNTIYTSENVIIWV